MTSDLPDGPTIEDVLAALADGPVDERELADRLDVDTADTAGVAALERLLDDPRIVPLADDRVAHGRRLVEGLVAWHRITEDEARTRTIELDHDALLLAGTLADPLTATVGDEVVELRMPTDPSGALDPERGPLLDLPEVWAPDLGPGDLIGYAEDDDHLALVLGPDAAAQDADPAPAVVDGLRRALDLLAARHRQPLLLAGDPAADEAPEGAWVLHLDEVGSLLLADHSDVVRALDRPLAEVAAASGLQVAEGTVLGPDATERDLAVYALGRALILDAFPDEQLEPGVAEAAGVAWLALTGEDDEEADDLAANAAAFVGDAMVAEALLARVWELDDDEADFFLARARSLAERDVLAPGPGVVLAEALVRTGAMGEARDLLTRLAVAVPTGRDEEWRSIHEAHGQMAADAGDVAAAQAAFRRTGEDDVAEHLQRWRPMPPAGVGRNDRCPCGSGRKAKQCCLLHPPAPDLAVRVPFVWWKLERACVRTRRRDLPWTSSPSPVVVAMAVDALLVEDGALAGAADHLAPVLPDDERELVAGWTDLAHGLHQVEGETDDGVTVRDLVTDAVVVVARDPEDRPAAVGDVWLTVLVPGPDGRMHSVGPILHPPAAARPLLVDTLAAGPDGQQLVDLVGALLD